MRDKAYLVGGVLFAATAIYFARDLLPGQVVFTWLLTFGGATAVAALMVALYRVRLELRASQHALARNEAELNFALEVQKALFPREFPKCQGLEFTAVCIPARGISGDYYDVLELPGERLVFAIADVSGKGISAAILMANFQALLRTLAANYESPLEVVRRLNRQLYHVTEPARFATFFYGEWHPATWTLRYINAGHTLPLLTGSRQGFPFECGGFPLGLFPDAEFEMGSLQLRPGDLMVLYSDGVTEVGSQNGEEFGEERLAQVIERHQNKPLSELQAEIMQSVQGWSKAPPEDDMTLVLVRATTC